MTRGRKPKPSKLRALHGNCGHRPLNDSEPQPGRAVPRCPAHLTKAARTEWHRLVKQLDAVALLTNLDRGALAMYCQAWGDHVDAQEMIKKTGVVVLEEGNLHRNPYYFVSNKAVEQMCKLGPLLGLDPSSRSRLHVERRPEDRDEMEILLAEGT
jgi:P27 family predicted phage terminase small subunit